VYHGKGATPPYDSLELAEEDMSEEFLVTETPDREPTHPGAILHEDVLPALKLSVSEAARQLGVTRQTLHRIIAGTHSITPEMALRLGRFCGNGPTLWVRMQIEHDLWQARQRLRDQLDKIPQHTQ
jgi:antitoxin HigA-1